MGKPGLKQGSMGREFSEIRRTGKGYIPFKLLIMMFGREYQQAVQYPVHVGSARPFIKLLADHLRHRKYNQRWTFQIAAGKLRPGEQFRSEFEVYPEAIPPSLGGFSIIEELVETSHLSRFYRLVGYQCPLESAKSRSTHRRRRQGRPDKARFRVELIPVDEATFEKIRARPKGEGQILKQVDLRIKV